MNSPKTQKMKKQLLLLLLAGCLFGGLQAQDDTWEGYNALSARLLLIDYGSPNEIEDTELTYGLELGYRRQFLPWVGLAIPLKLGVIDIGELNNPNFASIDAHLQLYPFRDEGAIVPYLLGGISLITIDFDEGHRQYPLGGGLNIRLGENSYLSLQAEYRLASVEMRKNYQLGAGYVYKITTLDNDEDGVINKEDACPDEPGPPELMGCPDRDGDGIPDRGDLCPDEAGPRSTQGCPDQDEDGVIDSEDECPTVAGDVNGCPDTDGDGFLDKDDACPEEAAPDTEDGCPLRDADEDGIVDEEDKCPDVPGVASADGCPDADGDGVPDDEDACPDLAGDMDGCPDTDGDGVHDGIDRCPEEAGTAANKGCPELKEETREVLEFATEAVQFETGSARLTRESRPVLDQLVAVMEQYPAYSLIISGHTDNVGNNEANQRLSEARAKASYDYLVSKGVDPDRMSYAGFGEDEPRADNKTAAGRRLNRRVEFELKII